MLLCCLQSSNGITPPSHSLLSYKNTPRFISYIQQNSGIYNTVCYFLIKWFWSCWLKSLIKSCRARKYVYYENIWSKYLGALLSVIHHAMCGTFFFFCSQAKAKQWFPCSVVWITTGCRVNVEVCTARQSSAVHMGFYIFFCWMLSVNLGRVEEDTTKRREDLFGLGKSKRASCAY